MQARNIVEHLMVHTDKVEFVLSDENGERIGDVGAFVIRLLQANRGFVEPNELHASNFLGSGRGEARAVGSEINALYGFGGMFAVHDVIASLLLDGVARELEAAWAGIGDWEF